VETALCHVIPPQGPRRHSRLDLVSHAGQRP
jgi:hypothetical protein